jgi:hypothetical protein
MGPVGLAIGAAIDYLMAAFLLLVFGFIMDSWHDRNPWAGPVVTTMWAIAFILCAGGPIVAYWLRRRNAPPGRTALVMWLPALLLVGICVVGYLSAVAG